jgi:hypothetical protein
MDDAFINNSGATYCEPCFNQQGLHPHDWDPPQFLYYGNGEASAFLGMELEIECGSNGVDILSSFDPEEKRFYLKKDGSLKDDGIEIVSHPHTYAELVRIEWQSIFKKLVDAGYTSHDNGDCGLHFHLSRSYLGKIGQAKLIFLTEKLKESFFRFSRRTRSTFNQWARSYFDETSNLQEKSEKLGNYDPAYDRYRMVNITNEHTIEIRFIRGTLNYSTWLASAQLAHTLAEICKKEDWPRIKTIGFPSIIKYCGFLEIAEYWDSRKKDTEDQNEAEV